MAEVTVSSVIDAPVEKVWARIRDFNGLPGWHPRMVKSHIEDGKSAETIGCVRNFELASGARIREKLLDFSDANFRVSYSILETPQPLTNHKAMLQLRRVTDGDRTYAEWTATFDAAPEEADKIAAGMAANVFQGGFNALKSHFSGQS
ncbi:SRPBCC family protein [Mesorhizobium sp. C386A]|uniref:SRPBCC family protein n=1 Tax=unclassified Mesorhizobium TaxID=325217 RepID=UPI0003CE7F9E|nr:MULTISPECIES: SRPBCC family protein [unclassified Mesorhizobium]ESY05533.1 polyketide cyclase [Mesorhizobium sp. LNJC398B00]ESY38906.1 polyketide cyclase [Mesorhizobium sp. LNJC386A00]